MWFPATHVILNVQIAAGPQQDPHNFDVVFISGQMQRSPAILYTHTHAHNLCQNNKVEKKKQWLKLLKGFKEF